jgi:hypothetical protein
MMSEGANRGSLVVIFGSDDPVALSEREGIAADTGLEELDL